MSSRTLSSVTSSCFLGDATTIRYVVDSYLKHETLSSNIEFKNSTRWQPRPLHGQLYISPSLMEGYKNWAQQPSTTSQRAGQGVFNACQLSAPANHLFAFQRRVWTIHEVHIPRNLILMAVAGISGEVNPPPMVQNERMAIGIDVYDCACPGRVQKEKQRRLGYA